MIEKITADQMKAFPVAQLAAYSREEVLLDMTITEFMWRKSGIWQQVRDDQVTCFFGLFQNGFSYQPYFWFLLTSAFRPIFVRELSSAVRQSHPLFPDAYTLIEPAFRTGRKFAEHCGFAPTPGVEPVRATNGREYIHYKVNK